MNILLYFPAYLRFSDDKNTYFAKFNFKPTLYDASLINKADVLLLATPVKVGDTAFVSPESVWKKFILEHHQELKIIQVGISEAEKGLNYLNWLDLPTDFSDFVQQSVSVKEHWQPKRMLGEKLEDLWQKFWDGHDEQGFKNWFISIRHKVNIIIRNIENEEYDLEAALNFLQRAEWENILSKLKQRWNRYYVLFSASPINHIFEEVDQNISRITSEWLFCDNENTLISQARKMEHHLQSVHQFLETAAFYMKKA